MTREVSTAEEVNMEYVEDKPYTVKKLVRRSDMQADPGSRMKRISKKVNVGKNERIASAVAGTALIAYGVQRKDWAGALLGLLGAGLTYRGTTGQCELYRALDIDTETNPIGPAVSNKVGDKLNTWFDQKVEVIKSVAIERSPAELYQFWRNFENLPQFMVHLESVKNIDDKRSKWTAKAPLGTEVSWEAVIKEDTPNEKISWASTVNSDIQNSGKVEFIPTSRGTEVKVTLKYEPPAGIVGAFAAYFLQEEPDKQVESDLKRFKKLMETGSIITVEGQSSGRKEDIERSEKFTGK